MVSYIRPKPDVVQIQDEEDVDHSKAEVIIESPRKMAHLNLDLPKDNITLEAGNISPSEAQLVKED